MDLKKKIASCNYTRTTTLLDNDERAEEFQISVYTRQKKNENQDLKQVTR